MGPHFASQHSSYSALISSISPSGSLLTSETPQLKNGWTLSNHTWRAAEDEGNTSLRCIKGEKRRTDQEIRFATSSRQSGNGVGLHQRRAAAARQFSSVLICGASMWTSNWEPHFGSCKDEMCQRVRGYTVAPFVGDWALTGHCITKQLKKKKRWRDGKKEEVNERGVEWTKRLLLLRNLI